MKKVESREYKMMLCSEMFHCRKQTLSTLRRDLQDVFHRLGIKAEGKFDSLKRGSVRFLDTPDANLRANGLVLRHRKRVQGKESLTLKRRFADRYVVAHCDLASTVDGKEKFEEDIAPPFRSRFSRSVKVASDLSHLPQSVGEAAKVYPVLGELKRDGGKLDSSTPLRIVGNFVPRERVYYGLELSLAAVPASVAVILWAPAWKRRIVAAELSFRYRNSDEKYPARTTQLAFDLFAALIGLPWCDQDSVTKTEFVYRLLG